MDLSYDADTAEEAIEALNNLMEETDGLPVAASFAGSPSHDTD